MNWIVHGVTESDMTERLSLSRSKEGAEMFLLFKNVKTFQVSSDTESQNPIYFFKGLLLLSCSVVTNSLTPQSSLPGSSVHGISQARILERVAMPSSRGSS